MDKSFLPHSVESSDHVSLALARSVSCGRNQNQTVNNGVAHSKNPKKCAYHVTFDLDLDLDLESASLVAIRPTVCEKKRFAILRQGRRLTFTAWYSKIKRGPRVQKYIFRANVKI